MTSTNEPPTAPGPHGQHQGTADLIRKALDETRHLVRLEVAIARDELGTELRQAKAAGVALGAAAAAGIVSLAMFLVAIALAFSTPWLAAVIIATVLVGVAASLALLGWKEIPTRPMLETKERLETDLKQLKERLS